MGAHSNQQMHKRVAALKQRRLPPDVEASKLKELIARFSPTAQYTQSLTDATTAPTDTATPPAVTTPVPPTTPPVTPTPTPPVTPTTPSVPTSPATSDTNTNPTTDTSATNVNTTSAPPPVVIPNTSTTPVAPAVTPLTSPPSVVLNPTKSTLSITVSSTVASSAASATESTTSGSGTNVGGIVGGLAGGLLGLAVLVFIVRFLMNRKRRREDEDAGAFNATDFRRSAVLMDDPPTHDETVERGFNPRPPTMIERRLASPAPTFGTQYGAPGPAAGSNDYDYNQYQAYGPSQMRSPNSAHPMFSDPAYPSPAYPHQPYGQSPFSPIGSPVGMNPYEGSQQSPVLTRQPSNATQLSRAPSSNGPNGYPSEDPHYGGYPIPAAQNQNEYVDLDRSSVTPYQAAQYAEISQKLHTEVPTGLDTPAVTAFIQNQNNQAPPLPAESRTPSPSPFSDPAPGQLPYPGEVTPRPSTDLDDFPAPPSPAHSGSSRVNSIPPTLPEIYVDSRPSSYDFPASVRGSDIASGFPSGVTKDYLKSPLGNHFPSTPSPLASSFGIPTPPAAATSFPEVAPPTPRLSKTEVPVTKRPETVYDDDDAYGGI
ncbi:hypothetical protein DXG01_015290 [Tephrocybe rancida]|nr:hypothetical protein DXG01_015290 [Tephrocybe rancida]